MARSLFALLHRRYGTRLSGATLAARTLSKQADFASWFGLASLPSDCAKNMPSGVAIIGAGFAGISAAWTLGKAGVSSTVFEARSNYGGRVDSDRSVLPHRVVEAGAELIGMNHPMWLDLAKQFGLGLSVITSEDEYAAAGLEVPLRFGGKPVPDRQKLYTQMDFVLQKISDDAKKVTDAFEPWKTPGAAALDAKTVADKLADFVRLVPSPRHPQLMDALEMQIGNDNVLPTKNQSYLGLLALVQGGRLGAADKDLEGYWKHREDYRCTEGNNALAGMMIERGQNFTVQVQSPVVKIAISDVKPFVRITWMDPQGLPHMKDFDYVILTAPPTVWKNITITPPIPPGNLMGQGPGVKYISYVKNRFWIKYGQAPSGFSDDFGQTWEATDNQAIERQGIAFSVFAGGKYVPTTNPKLHFQTELVKLYPGYKMLADRYADWPNEKWIETGYACPNPGQVTTVGKFLSVPHAKRMFFAGEHACLAYFGYMEGALQSGARAAKAILSTCATGAGGEQPKRDKIPHEIPRAKEFVAVGV